VVAADALAQCAYERLDRVSCRTAVDAQLLDVVERRIALLADRRRGVDGHDIRAYCGVGERSFDVEHRGQPGRIGNRLT
jgi:hypothetical protein